MIVSGACKFAGDPDKLSLVWDALRAHPLGATAKVIAGDLGWKAVYASQRLGKLAVYGIIDRVPNPNPGAREFRYSIKRHVHA